VNGRQCLAVRVYPGRPDSVGVALRSIGQDTTLASFDAWTMASIWTQEPPSTPTGPA
jgi:beta-fructofuranosidase